MDQHTQSRRNRLLELLPASDFDRLRPDLQYVAFDYKMPLYEAQEPIQFAYFPITGVASLVTPWWMGPPTRSGPSEMKA